MRVRAFLQRYEHSRFRALKSHLSDEERLAEELREQLAEETGKPREGEARSLDLAGFKGNREGVGQLFHFNTEIWKAELFAGMDAGQATRALKAAGFLVSNGEDGKRLTNKVKVPGGARNFYSVSGAILRTDISDAGI